jgi:hypothetical protein
MFADYVELHDINSLVRTSWVENRLLTPIHVPACQGPKVERSEAILLKAVDAGNFTAVRHFIEDGTSANICKKVGGLGGTPEIPPATLFFFLHLYLFSY